MTVPEHPVPFQQRIAPSTPSPEAGVGAAAESVPQIWDESRDPTFFALTARLFDPATTLAMTVLLASYDVESTSVPAGQQGR